MASVNIIDKTEKLTVPIESLNKGQMFIRGDRGNNVYLAIGVNIDSLIKCYDLSANLICELKIGTLVRKVEADLIIK